jgi:hypothetical protein
MVPGVRMCTKFVCPLAMQINSHKAAHVATHTHTPNLHAPATAHQQLYGWPAGQQQSPTLGPSAFTTRHAFARRSMLSGVSFTSLLPSSILKSSSTASRRPFCKQQHRDM